jgi:hypothetical protein
LVEWECDAESWEPVSGLLIAVPALVESSWIVFQLL